MLELQLAAVTTSLRHVTSCHFDTKYIFGAKATSILVDNSPSLVSRLQGKLDSDKVLVAISAAGLKEDISTDLAHAIWCERVYSVDRLLTATAIQQQYTLQQPMAPLIHRGTDSLCMSTSQECSSHRPALQACGSRDRSQLNLQGRPCTNS